MTAILENNRGMALVITISISAILMTLLAASLLFSGLNLRITSHFKNGTQAFYAADAGVYVGINQLSANRTTATAPFSGTLDGGLLAYRSGRRSDSGPQPLEFRGTRFPPGYSIGLGTGYNQSGYVSYVYRMNVTGTAPLSAASEIEAWGEYGPLPN